MLTPLHPLRSSGDEDVSPLAPEALLISAMLEIGDFSPVKHHVATEDIEAWRKLWLFCLDYQERAGVAPPLSLVMASFPDFEVHHDISAEWAAAQVLNASAARRVRHSLRDSLGALAEDDLEGAFSALEGIERPRTHRKEALSVFDHASAVDDFEVSRIEVPYPSLGRATGGIGPGELWYLGARLGQGKTWVLLKFGARAAQCGYHVAMLSCEMPAKVVARRSHQLLVENNGPLYRRLRDPDMHVYKQALDEIKARTPGRIDILDPSHGRINTTSMVSELASEYDLILFDHVGLLMHDGKRAIDDWRVQATISNILREITLSSGTPLLGAAQINREGERTGSGSPPKAGNLAGSDVLGQDADVLVTMRRRSRTVMVNSLEKARNAANLWYWTRFDPEHNRFGEITMEEAITIGIEDEGNVAHIE